jgi:transcriptional regulator with XRE-family HTH domain
VALPQGIFYKTLGERVRHARLDAGFTQGQLADSVGLARSSVANIESGRQPIYVDALVRIASELQTSISELLPATSKELDASDSEDIKKLHAMERHFTNLILSKSTLEEKEKDGPKIFSSKKTSGRTTKTNARPKSPGAR